MNKGLEKSLNYNQIKETCTNYGILKLSGVNPFPFLIAAYFIAIYEG